MRIVVLFFLRTMVIAAAFFAMASAAHAATLYWRPGGNQYPDGKWDINNTVAWSTTFPASAPNATWNPNDGTVDAQFAGIPSGIITVNGDIKANSIIFATTGDFYTYSGTGTLELISGTIATTTRSTIGVAHFFNLPITVTGGGDLIVANNTDNSTNVCCNITLGAANTFGNLRVMGSTTAGGRQTVNLNNLQAIKNNSLTDRATVYLDRNGAQLGFSSGSTNVWDGQTFFPDIFLNSSGGATAVTNAIGVNASNEVNYKGTITSNGPANLVFALGASGGTGVFNLFNAASYSGFTQFTGASTATHLAGAIRNLTGADNALPATTRLVFGPISGSAAAGAYDLNGLSQTITGISTSASPSAIGGVINTDPGNQGTLKINVIATQNAYTGNIGIPYESLTTNSGTVLGVYHAGANYATNDNIAVQILASSNPAAVVEFKRAPGMTYIGGTTIDGGTLLLTNTSGSGTGSGAVNVNSGGTLGGTGSTAGLVTVNSGGHIAPGSSIGLFTTTGGLTLISGSMLDVELGVPGTNDLINVPLSGGLAINGGTVNVTNAGGLALGTYVLIDYTGTLNGIASNLMLGNKPADFSFQLVHNTSNKSIDLLVTPGGDFDHNGTVDAADYVLWRKGLGTTYTQVDFEVWRAHYGQTSALGGGTVAGAVPEPAAGMLLAAFALPIAGAFQRRRR